MAAKSTPVFHVSENTLLALASLVVKLKTGDEVQLGPQELTLAHLIAYAFVVTVLIDVTAAAYKGLPISNVFSPMRSWPSRLSAG